MARSKRVGIFGAALCAGAAALMILGAIVSLCAFCLAFYAPEILKGKIMQESGFYASADKVNYNPFTGEFKACKVRISSPRDYPERNFMEASELVLDISPLKFLSADFEFTKLSAKISSLNFVLLSPTKNSLNDFLIFNSNLFKPAANFEGAKIEISNLFFSDISDPENRFERKFTTPIKIEFDTSADSKSIKEQTRRAFKEADAQFLTTNISYLRD